MSSLFQEIGGENAVNAAVDIFYRKVLIDPRINIFFDDVDMDAQLAKQKAFLTMAFGGPSNYSGLELQEGHKHLVERGLNDSHVDTVIELLAETLEELQVSQEQIAQVGSIAESVRNQVLGRV